VTDAVRASPRPYHPKSRALLLRSRMLACPLRKEEDAGDDNGRENCGGIKAVEGAPAFFQRLVEQVAERRAERARQDEGAHRRHHARLGTAAARHGGGCDTGGGVGGARQRREVQMKRKRNAERIATASASR
jgi:hypothetical protein